MQAIKRADIPVLRAALGLLKLMVAEVDRELRYVWIDLPHSDFSAEDIVGKRDDDLITKEAAAELIQLKQEVLGDGKPRNRILAFLRSDGWRFYSVCVFPVLDAEDKVEGLFTVATDTPEILRGILPICSHCKRIRDEQGAWRSFEHYVTRHSQAEFSHGICPECLLQHYNMTPEAT